MKRTGLSITQQNMLALLLVGVTICNWAYRMTVEIYVISRSIEFTVLCLIFCYITRKHLFSRTAYLACTLFLAVLAVYVIYGIFNARSYWHYRDLITNTLTLCMPAVGMLAYSPSLQKRIWKIWLLVSVPVYFCVIQFLGLWSSIQFCMGPVYFLFGTFFFFMPKKWKVLVGIILLYMLFADFGSRSQVIKAAFTILMACVIAFKRFVPRFCLDVASWVSYALPLLLLYLGLTGTFNVFDPSGKGLEDVDWDDVTLDTRTFIYVEVLESAVKNDYVFLGRSPARGNDTQFFTSIAEALNTEYVERNFNELCHLNVFTWMGIFGVVLFSLIYLQATWLALYRSRNFYVKCLAVVVSFHWAYGWVEDLLIFDTMNLGLWTVIGICLSPKFRRMTDLEFRLWFQSFFVPVTQVSPYQVVQILKLKLRLAQLGRKH